MIDLLEHAERETDRTIAARDHLAEIVGELLTEIEELRSLLDQCLAASQPMVLNVWRTPGEEAL